MTSFAAFLELDLNEVANFVMGTLELVPQDEEFRQLNLDADWGGSSREAKAGDHRTDTEARGQLRIACQMLGAMGMEAFAERAAASC